MSAAKGRQIMRALKKLAEESETLGLNDFRMVVALERAVARVEAHQELSKSLVFKGGFVLLKAVGSERFTRDIDALAKNTSQDVIASSVTGALSSDLGDGLWYGDLKTRDLGRDLPYPGIRFDAAFQIGEPPAPNKVRKLSRIHLDIGFGDYMPSALRQVMPSVLPDEKPVSWSIYPLEQIVAEKLQTLIAREAANSRAKDVYDLVILLRDHNLDHERLKEAIAGTFAARKTDLPDPLNGDLSTMDHTFLKAAWGSVELTGGEGTFEEYWAELMRLLGDQYVQ